MSKPAKKDATLIALQKVIDEQAEKLKLYEKKIAEVVAAFKSLRKEKEALEETVKALTSAHHSTPEDIAPSPNEHDTEESRASPAPSPFSDRSDINSPCNDNVTSNSASLQFNPFSAKISCQQCGTLKKRLKTLTQSIATLNEEKRRMEEAYLSEKKILKENAAKERSRREMELERSISALQQELKEQSQRYSNLEVLLHQTEAEVRKGLESVEQERNLRSVLQERWNQDTKHLLQEKAKREDELEGRISEISLLLGESERMRLIQEISINQLQQTCSLLEGEKQRDNDTTTAPQIMAFTSSMEFVHPSLSREIDLLRDTRISTELQFLDTEEEVDHYWRLFRQILLHLHQANQKLEEPLPLQLMFCKALRDESTCGGLLLLSKSEDWDNFNVLRSSCVLLGSYDNVALTSNSVSTPEKPPSNDENDNRVVILQQRLDNLYKSFVHNESAHYEAVEKLKQKIANMEEKHSLEMRGAKQEYDSSLAELHRELLSHRNRTIRLLEEKDQEISALKDTVPSHQLETDEIKIKPSNRSVLEEEDLTGNGIAKDLESILLTANSTSKSKRPLRPGSTLQRATECNIFHCAEVKARKDMEIARLRNEKHELEENVRHLKHELSEMETRCGGRIDELKRKVEELQTSSALNEICPSSHSLLEPNWPSVPQHPVSLNQNVHSKMTDRPNTTIEYLRNVVFHYLTMQSSLDSAAKLNLIRVIASVLQFSPQQKKALEKGIEAS